MPSKNIVKISAAGSGKTWDICNDALMVTERQGVKVLIPDFESVKNEVVSHEVIEELVTLKETAYSYGLKDYQIPNDLNTIYNNRTMVERDKPTKCWSSLISPPLYGTNLMSCVLWDRITDLNYH